MLAGIAEADLSNEAFPYMRAREIVLLRTRGTVAAEDGGKPILARAGHRLDDPIEPDGMPGTLNVVDTVVITIATSGPGTSSTP